jgi:2-polyprenyl-3-methyl-5-hydroxy-6-metoxy-1,4-benzoquinol methylase
MSIKTLERCPNCMSDLAQPYVKKDGYKFLKCTCGYIFCHPRPTQAELDKHYGVGEPSEYAQNILTNFYPKASSRRRRAFFNAIKLFPYVWGKRVMDLGCGGGFVVGNMKAVGARVAVGIDINPNSISYASAQYPSCEFHCGEFADFPNGKLGKFDFIYSSEVIEHVVDIEAYMQFLVEITDSNAKVFITTPDIASKKVPEDVTSWDVFSPPMHIQFFTQTTLTQLFKRFGFTPIKRTTDRGGAGLKMLFKKSSSKIST